MIHYLIDSSGLWRLLRDDQLRKGWAEVVTIGAVGSCQPQQAEFRRSARTVSEYEQMSAMFGELYPAAATPKTAWRWIESAQYKLAQQGAHRALSCVDLLICATAAHHQLVVLHDDTDFVTAARHLPDVHERNIHNVPPLGPAHA